MQRLDFGHPGERQLIVGPVTLRDDGDLVVAGAFERPVVTGGDVLDHRERIIRRIDDAFEQGHAVSTLPLDVLIRTRAMDTIRLAVSLQNATPSGRSLRRSSDVICGIRATAPGLRPQANRTPSTTQLAGAVNDWNKTESARAFVTMVNFRCARVVSKTLAPKLRRGHARHA